MSIPQEKNPWLEIPYGIKVVGGAASLIGVGVMFLTTIEHGLKVSLYGGIGAFCISFAVGVLIWAAMREL